MAPPDIPQPRLFKATGARINPHVEWIEVETKSVLNAVKGMGFKWSINPYRGCQHACLFCLDTATPVLMTDGRQRPLGALRPGDEIFGTETRGWYRRYAKTRVLATWRTTKPAYRICLEDGTLLIASGDHRFLTEHGWKFVTGAEQGPLRRPFLTRNDKLMGTGRHTVDPAISRKRDIAGQALKSPARLGVVAIEPLGRQVELVDITTGTGDFIANGVVSHNCYARQTHWYLDQDGVNDWGSRIFVKVNAPELLRHELGRPSWKREEVQIGTATDPYQPAEGAYRITRRILEALRDYRTPVGLITRSTMVMRDLDVLQQLQKGPGAEVCVSVATLDEKLAGELEPGAPPPLRRLEAVQTLSRAGIPTVVMLAPVLPGITDDVQNITEVIAAAKRYGAGSLATIALHLGDVAKDAFFEYLTHRRPELVPEYRRLYVGKYAPAAYRSQVQRVAAAVKARIGFRDAPGAAESPAPEAKPPSQTLLFQEGAPWTSRSGSSSTSTRPTRRETGPDAASPRPSRA